MSDTLQGTARDVFVTGLKNAHALENQALSIMNRQLDRLVNYPDLSQRLRVHVEETNVQLQRVEDLLGDLGESHSSLKDTALSFVGNMAALGHTVAGDETLKNCFADLAFENYEIATYRSLLAVAEAGGFSAAKSSLQASLDEEERMARWIYENVPTITQRYLELYRTGGSDAKR